jgi:hypothetical protein
MIEFVRLSVRRSQVVKTMTDDDIDPENPCPEGHYPRFRDNQWHYIPDELAQTISLGPGGDGEEGQDWILTYTPENGIQTTARKFSPG